MPVGVGDKGLGLGTVPSSTKNAQGWPRPPILGGGDLPAPSSRQQLEDSFVLRVLLSPAPWGTQHPVSWCHRPQGSGRGRGGPGRAEGKEMIDRKVLHS